MLDRYFAEVCKKVHNIDPSKRMEADVTQDSNGEVSFSAYTVKNLAKKIQLSESMLWKLIKNGQVKTIKIGRRTLVPASELTRILTRGVL